MKTIIGAIACALGLMAVVSSAHAQTTLIFNYTGASQSWVVPAGVSSVDILAEGAQGFDSPVNLGGRGGRSSGTLAVEPGETLTIFVGGKGSAATVEDVPMGAGFNGGGDGMINWDDPINRAVGGGGGASDVRRGLTLNDRLIVAGGGGGATSNYNGFGGDGGGLIGGDGGSYPGSVTATGGTQMAGGTLRGTFGVGGSADGTSTPWVGGGGGGWYGGGVSDGHAGGAGGSSYLDGVGLTATSTVGGVRAGDGFVTITFTPGASPAAIPTMTEWAMIILGTIMAGGAALYIQRRRQSV